MEQLELIRKILMWGSIVLLILSVAFFRKGKKMSRLYGKKHMGRMNKVNLRATMPVKFSEDSIIKAAHVIKSLPNCYLAFDTNILLDYPYVLVNLGEDAKILISEQVRRELDKIKDSDSEASDAARIALKIISNLHKDNRLEIVQVDKKKVEELGLDPNSGDDLIIGSYLERVKEGRQVVFITNDNNARTTARTTKLKVLELDWEEKLLIENKKRKTPVYRPGYAYKLFAIISFSLCAGFFNGMIHIEEKMKQEVQPVMATSSGKGGPAYVKGDYPYVIKNEYGNSFQGKKAGDWGASAIVDIRYSDSFFARTLGNYQVTLGVWNTKQVEEKTNKLTYLIVLKNGKQYEPQSTNFFNYDKKQGIEIPSVNSRVKFENVNGYDSVGFNIEKTELKDLENAELRLVHKVTKEVIQTLPLKVLKK
ncbi:PIN domain-containing protein [Bacillus alveayuensis]|uniref:PIN domain-containing protein n=1 Tax=Aeribacillus alveayuensis TaxID=279215 RepID=UPI0005D0EA09|nr:PIN domain-containing protein [Bacillus alveayuensis]